METTEQLKKTYPEGTVFTMLKFERSKRDNTSNISFVSQDCKSGLWFGRNKNDRYPKKIVIAGTKINYLIIPGVLYRATLIPMKMKDGFIAIEVEPYQFKARVKTIYVPKAVYQVTVAFGHKEIVFDPKGGRKPSVNTLTGVLTELSKRMDIQNINDVLKDFEQQCQDLLDMYRKDGYYVKTA